MLFTVLKRNGKQYLKFNLNGAVGVDGKSCAKMGSKLCVISGKGYHSSDRTGWSSDSYPGRISCQAGMLYSITNTTAKPPCKDGHRLVHVSNVLDHGVKILTHLKVNNPTRNHPYEPKIQ